MKDVSREESTENSHLNAATRIGLQNAETNKDVVS